MQKSAKYALLACIVVVVAGGAAFWWFVLRDDAPERASVPQRTETTQEGGAEGTAPADPNGQWTVVTADDVFAGYRIEELFAAETIKSTAVGRTPAVSGSLVIDDGAVTQVEVTADMTLLESDESRRDSFIRSEGLQTSEFPTATFVLTEPVPLPDGVAVGDEVEVTVKGDLTLHGVTQPVELIVRATWNGGTISAAGGAPIALADYGIEPPSIPFVTVDDRGEFEMQLVFERA